MYFSFSPSPPSTSYTTAPMDIPSSSASRPQSPSCAYPCWPQRSSLSSSADSSSSGPEEPLATSYISDDDLFPCVFEDTDAESEGSSFASPNQSFSPLAHDVSEQVVVDHAAIMRELIAQEKEARRERRRRRRSGSDRKSRGSTQKPMTPILEAGE